MNDSELDVLLRATAPITDADVASLELSDAMADVRSSILSAETAAPVHASAAHGVVRRWRRARRLALLRAGPRRAVLVGGVLAALIVAAGIGIGNRAGGPSQAWAAPLVRFAESSPRILIDGGDYRVARADSHDGVGEMAFAPTDPAASPVRVSTGAIIMQTERPGDGSTGTARAYPAADLERRRRRLAETGFVPAGTAPELADSGRLYQGGTGRRFVALAAIGDHTVEVTGTAPGPESFRRLLATVGENIRPESLSVPQQIEAFWMPASYFEARTSGYGTPGSGMTDLGTTEALGMPVRWFAYDGISRYRAVWVRGAHLVEVDGVTADRAAFADALRRLVEVDVDRWLRAMPPSVIAPREALGTVETMLRDVPLPPGLRAAAIAEAAQGDVRDRYQLGAAVTGRVACGWIDEWVLGLDSGDPARVARAVSAMATSRKWTVLREMQTQGGWSDALWEHADVMSGAKATVSSGGTLRDTTRTIDGRTVTVPARIGDYASGLGCR